MFLYRKLSSRSQYLSMASGQIRARIRPISIVKSMLPDSYVCYLHLWNIAYSYKCKGHIVKLNFGVTN